MKKLALPIESGYSNRVQVPHTNDNLDCNIEDKNTKYDNTDTKINIDTISGDNSKTKKETIKKEVIKYDYKKTYRSYK